MRDPNYDLGNFVERVKDLSLYEIILEIQRTHRNIESGLYGVKGAVHRRELGAPEFLRELSQLGFFLSQGIKPNTITEGNWQLCRVVTERLVAKGELKPEIMKLFEGG